MVTTAAPATATYLNRVGQEALSPERRALPWNLMGTDLLLEGATNVAEALAQSGLDYKIEARKVAALGEASGSPTLPADGFRAMVRRERTGQEFVVGITGKRYTPVQNLDAFAPADVLAAEYGATFSGAADFRGGARSLLIMDLRQDTVLDKGGRNDRLDNYLIISNSHDGSGALTYALTPVRIECTNACTGAIAEADQTWKMSHTPNVAGRIQVATTAMRNALAYMDEFQAEAERMIQTEITRREFDKIVAGLFPLKADASDKSALTVAEQRDVVTRLYVAGEANEKIRGTRWGAYNAVTEYVDWFRPTRAADAMLMRAEGALDGPYVRLKARAWAAFSA